MPAGTGLPSSPPNLTFPLNPAPTQYSLYSTVINSSGMETVFSFIPPHGKRLAAGEQLTVAGNIIDRLAVKTSNRQFKAMERAVSSGLLTILYTPGQFVYDGSAKIQMVGVKGTGIGMVDPVYFEPGTTPPELPDQEEAERVTARR
jgi:hypothetical protein